VGLEADAAFIPEEIAPLEAFSEKISEFRADRCGQWPTYDFTKLEIDELLTLAQSAHKAFGGSDADILPIDADVPREFTGDQLLRSVEANAELLNVSEYIDTMLMRMPNDAFG